MMSLSHLLVILLIILLLFGAGKLPQVMADIAKGLKAFKENLEDNDKSSNTDKNEISGSNNTPKSGQDHLENKASNHQEDNKK